MTGFGKGECKIAKKHMAIEIKTVNHKFFDVTMKLPNGLTAFEDKIKEILQKEIKRGKVNLILIYEGALLKANRINIDEGVAKNYHAGLLRLKRQLRLKDDVGTKEIMLLPGVINYEVTENGLSRLWPAIRTALERAVKALAKDRQKEGRALYADLARRAKKIEAMLNIVKSRAHLNIDEYRKRFNERVKDITGGREIDMGRLEMEVAIFAKNSDISEEITRLKNHMANFLKTISSGDEVGKKLDFIAQELHREANTMGSKASDFVISKSVIDIKGEIEKIREQAKNLE